MNVVTLTNGDETLIIPLERIAQVKVELVNQRVGWFKRNVVARINLELVMPENFEYIDVTPKEAARIIVEINETLQKGRTTYSETYKAS